MRRFATLIAGAALAAASAALSANDVISVKRMTMELARDMAQASVEACRAEGYQVTAVVVDRSGDVQAVLRDVLAPRFTYQIARDKAAAVILSGVKSSDFRANRDDIRMEMNHVDGILVLEGGAPIEAAGSLVGAVGVSGAPGGHLDEICALKAIETVQERLDFAM
ncbi:GlcG/HbpS family heme-binding protein [Thioalkalivibrio thiocyanodenitrificans]|uniref:GlcG/HbpS family heme-binding protein n=1 Tax=Thioalkalivibrio thiocyanodenitrificans TaxID=243063 RepID=UPI00035C3D93|nr:heme-binding protein [Thioalkalivibrio thiocyanodenitrificans]